MESNQQATAESVLRIRELARDQEAVQYAALLSELEQIQRQKNEMAVQQLNFLNRIREMRTGVLSAQSLELQDQYQLQIARQIHDLEQKHAGLEQQIQQQRRAVAEAQQEVERWKRMVKNRTTAKLLEAQHQQRRQFGQAAASWAWHRAKTADN